MISKQHWDEHGWKYAIFSIAFTCFSFGVVASNLYTAAKQVDKFSDKVVHYEQAFVTIRAELDQQKEVVKMLVSSKRELAKIIREQQNRINELKSRSSDG